MKRLIQTGVLSSLAFAALGLSAERNASACQHPDPDPNPCAEMTESATTKLLAYNVVTSTTNNANCGCGGAIALPAGATLLGQGFFNSQGQASNAFCASGPNDQTAAAFQNVFGGNWGAGLSALSNTGVIGGQKGIVVYRYDNPTEERPDQIALAQVNFDENGNPVVDDTHQVVTSLPQCTNCDDEANASSAKCVALANAAAQLNGGTFAVGKTACAQTDAPAILGIAPTSPDDENAQDEQAGGCNASGSGQTAALLLGLAGVGLAIARRRRA